MKIKVVRTITHEYEIDKSYYPEGATPQEILDIDKAALEEEFFLDDVDEDKIVLTIIEE